MGRFDKNLPFGGKSIKQGKDRIKKKNRGGGNGKEGVSKKTEARHLKGRMTDN